MAELASGVEPMISLETRGYVFNVSASAGRLTVAFSSLAETSISLMLNSRLFNLNAFIMTNNF